jgi:hypothetical protein
MEARDLGGEHPAAEWCDCIVAATFILELWHCASIGFHHQSIGEQSLDDPIQIPRLERHKSLGALRHGLHQPIPMTLHLGEAEEELEIDRFER